MPISGTVAAHMLPLANYPHIDADATLYDVFAMLREKYQAAEQFRSVLVFDKDRHLVGKISLHDLLHALLPQYLIHLPARFEGTDDDLAPLALLWQEDSAKHCRKMAAQRVGDHVKPVARPLSPTDPMTLALFQFAVSDFNVIPVAEAGRIVGVLRIVDVLLTVANTVLAEGKAQ